MDLYKKAVDFWKTRPIQTASDIDLYLDNFRILFAYHSGRIENDRITLHDTREIFENGKVLNFTGDTRTLFEQRNQKLCYEFLKPKLVVKEPITLDFVKEIHAVLTAGTYDERRFVEQGERPGEFKKHDYVTGQEEVGSPPDNVHEDLSDLLSEISEYEDKDVLKVAAYFHLRFEYIHPFADGNGRVGRALLNYFLMTHGHPPLIIYDDDKADYYTALERYDRDEDIEAMYAFLIRETEKTWGKTLARQ